MASAVRRSQLQTGGGPPAAAMSDVDQRVLAIVPNQVIPLRSASDSHALVGETASPTPVQTPTEIVSIPNQQTSQTPVSDDEEESVPAQIKTNIARSKSATIAFSAFYRLKRQKLEREMVHQEEATLRKKCLQIQLQIKEKELEMKSFQLNQLTGQSSEGPLKEEKVSIVSVYHQLR